jgi:hypothetical protein
MPYDPRCHELAAQFLDQGMGVEDSEVDALAQTIQDAIEAWLNGHEAARRPPLR